MISRHQKTENVLSRNSTPFTLSRRRFVESALAGSAALCVPFLARGQPAGESVSPAIPRPPGTSATTASAPRGNWIPLFNGKNLEGWTPKITGYDLGDNYGNTFRVENGVMKVAYDQYEKFDNRFGHIFYKEKYSRYIIRVEYRFVGKQTPGGPGWAFRNSGIMLHCQPPESMEKGQDFPVSIEVQLLGGDGTNPRTTGNVCTPGTNIVMAGQLITQHCNNSTSKTYHGDQWVSVEVEVRGNGLIKHIIEGQTVLQYSQPQLDETDASAQKLLKKGAPRMLSEGYISLQSESHPVEFRKVELMPLGI